MNYIVLWQGLKLAKLTGLFTEVLLLYTSACTKEYCRLYKSVNGRELTPISYRLSVSTVINKTS